jgi:putative endonuclease
MIFRPGSRFFRSFAFPVRSGHSIRQSGVAAEQRAARYLFWRGWRICARNWIGGGGELDLVCSRWKTLLIVEVRQRPTVDQAFMSVDRAKLDRTLSAAAALVRAHGLQRYRLRVDVIAVDGEGRLYRRCDVTRADRL